MIRELCKHFFEKSFRICECAGRCLCPGRNGVASQRVLGHAIHFDSRFALQNVPPPLRNALGSYPIPTLQPRTPSTILKRILGLIQSLWLGFAEPLCGEAGAKAPASLNSY